MTTTVHVTQYFSTSSPRIFDECDRLMTSLIDHEETDPSVRDASVSADAGLGLVEVTVVADGATEDEATQSAIARMHEAVASIVTVIDGPLQERGHPITELASVV